MTDVERAAAAGITAAVFAILRLRLHYHRQPLRHLQQPFFSTLYFRIDNFINKLEILSILNYFNKSFDQFSEGWPQEIFLRSPCTFGVCASVTVMVKMPYLKNPLVEFILATVATRAEFQSNLIYPGTQPILT